MVGSHIWWISYKQTVSGCFVESAELIWDIRWLRRSKRKLQLFEKHSKPGAERRQGKAEDRLQGQCGVGQRNESNQIV